MKRETTLKRNRMKICLFDIDGTLILSGGAGKIALEKSLIEAFGEGNFSRLRLGIDRPGGNDDVSDYVLRKFNPDERKILSSIISRARDSVVTIIVKGIKEGMNQVNNRNMLITD